MLYFTSTSLCNITVDGVATVDSPLIDGVVTVGDSTLVDGIATVRGSSLVDGVTAIKWIVFVVVGGVVDLLKMSKA